MNRLMQRLAQLEQIILPAGRAIVIFEDIHFEDTEQGSIAALPRSGDRPRT
jgi:hypothetical protein